MLARYVVLPALAAISFGCQSQAQMRPSAPEPTSALPVESAFVTTELLPGSDAVAHDRRDARSFRGIALASHVGPDQLGRVTVTGGNVDDASQVAAAMLPSFQRCKMKWNPNTTGDLQVSAKIGPVGEVRFAKPESERIPPMVVACVTANVAGAKFAPPSGNDPTVVIPIHFARQ